MDWPTTCNGVKYVRLDNFGICRLLIGGQEWVSIEQYYQASQFADPLYRETFLSIKPRRNMGTLMAAKWHGQEIRRMGESNDHERVHGFKKLEEMYVANRVKFDQNPECRKQLLQTRGPIKASGNTDYWQLWNSRILERIREELKPPVECDNVMLETLRNQFSQEESFDEASAQERVRVARAEFGSDQFRVVASLMDGKAIELYVHPRDSILVMKEQLGFEIGVSAPRLKIVIGAKVLDDVRTIEECDVADGATVSVFVSSPVPYDAQIIKSQLHDALRGEGKLNMVE